MPFSYSIVDVFTKKRFGGNPVAVIHDASGLEQDVMQAIAREFGFSETTFITPTNDTRSTAHVRIFTPFEEIPFAGHPNIGTAFVLGTEDPEKYAASDMAMQFEQLGGAVSVRLVVEKGLVCGASIIAPQPLHVLGKVKPGLAARCLGLPEEAIMTERIDPCVASVGLPFAFVEVSDLDSLASISPDIAAFREAQDIGPTTVDGFAICAFVVEKKTEGRLLLRTRVLSPLGHPPEDPATGSASGALCAMLTRISGSTDRRFTLLQGVEMGRPSEIEVEIGAEDGAPMISGYCVHVSHGELFV